ncbi:Dyp-type peroxidase [Enteractinococcus helveticum]|uniref:Dyp-type peroxidase n=1 Tax=Enteractinococcus helveticum TaxID=1837282 RepID=UPI0005C2B4A8
MNKYNSAPKQPVLDVSRRGLLLGAGGIVGGGLVGVAAGYSAASVGSPVTPGDLQQPVTVSPGIANTQVTVSDPYGTDIISFYGPRQAGVDTPLQAHGVFIGLYLHDDTDADRLASMMRLVTDDAARLTQGRGALADLDEELAAAPARLTVTFGFGSEVFNRTRPELKPSWLKPLPEYDIDQLDPAYTGGDMVIQIQGDDPLSVAHARRMLLKDARAFASIAWVQTGFTHARASHPDDTTMRNLFGQIDGTGNPTRGSETAERVIWGVGDGDGNGTKSLQPWIENGTSMVVRRIAMNVDEWDELDRPMQESVIGRRLGSGAPLTGEYEHDEPDFDAPGPTGFPVIADISHIRRARTSDSDEAMFRRSFNYDELPTSSGNQLHGHTGVSESGLIFVAFQCDVDQQYIPIQDRLAETDHLNLWTIPVGSAVFAIPPGCEADGFIGEPLFV